MQQSRTVVVMGVIALVVIVFLIFRLFLSTSTLSDITVVLYQQLMALREAMLVRVYAPTSEGLAWHNDVLLIHGRKGELLIRRYDLQREWVSRYGGISDAAATLLRERINDTDNQLRKYRTDLRNVTALTERMLQEVYHGGADGGVGLTRSILRQLRNI